MIEVPITDLSADAAGEYLRGLFFRSFDFEPQYPNKVTHRIIEKNIADEFSDVTNITKDQFTEFTCTLRLYDELVTAVWYWDNDWHLEFNFDGQSLVNDDAKKDRGWMWYE